MKTLALSLAAVLCASAILDAAPITISAHLTPGQEVPAPDLTPSSNPMGFGSATIDLDAATFEGLLSWMDMTTPVAAGHLHRRNPGALTGPPVVTFFQGVSLPLTDQYSTGSLALTATQVSAIQQGLSDGTLYFNVHTTRNPPGEIRGDIAAIPEPSSLLLIGAGATLLLLGRRTRSG